MRLSERVTALKPSATLAVDAKVKALRAAGENIIGLGAGEPDFDTPDFIKQAAIDALKAGRTKYTATEGDPAARAAIAEKLQRDNGIHCGPEHIVISAGGKHCFYLVMQCLLDPPHVTGGLQREVIVPTPAWVSYRPIIELAGGKVVETPGSVENDFKITPRQLEQAIGPDTAAVVINTPSNPCGTMYSPDELRQLARVLERHPQIVIITDEIYEKLIYTDVPHFSLGSLPGIAQRVVTINGMSKAYAMTGWRIGYTCAPGNGGVLAKAIAKLQGQMTSNITSFNYPAIVAALQCGGDSVQAMRQAFALRATLIHDRIRALPGIRCPRPTGAFYVFPDVSASFGRTSPSGKRIDSALGFAQALLEDAKVAVVPGEDFGQCARNHVRLSFACSEANIIEGCDRIERWLQTLK